LAKVTGPLMSIDARGSIAKSITFAGWRGINYCRKWFTPANPQTADQTHVRGIFKKAINGWHYKITTPNRTAWIAAAEGQPYSGFNYYVSEYCKKMAVGQAPSATPPG